MAHKNKSAVLIAVLLMTCSLCFAKPVQVNNENKLPDVQIAEPQETEIEEVEENLPQVLEGIQSDEITPSVVVSEKIPENVKDFIKASFPKTNFRFDGLITLPDGTIYLPLFPAKIVEPGEIKITEAYPNGNSLVSKPNIVVLNNNFVLLKVLVNSQGQRTIYNMENPPQVIHTGLLPQSLQIPQGLVVPESMKSIIGNLNIQTVETNMIRVNNKKPVVSALSGSTLKTLSNIPALKNKNFYVSSPYSRNIQVLNLGAKNPEYSLQQNNVPCSVKSYNNEYLLIAAYDKLSIDVVALNDDTVVKQIELKTQPDEILIDEDKKIAYVVSSEGSSIYLINLETMTLFKQIKITGFCEKLTMSEDGTKMFYYDKRTSDIWAVELDNNYLLKEIGKFPNVSKIVYSNNKVYVTSRTKNRLAIIDYDTVGLIAEFEICDRPIDMLEFHGRVYVLGARDNSIQVIDSSMDVVTNEIYLNTEGFSTKIEHVKDTNIALITDTKSALYTIFDLGTNQVIKTIPIDIPASSIVVVDKALKH